MGPGKVFVRSRREENHRKRVQRCLEEADILAGTEAGPLPRSRRAATRSNRARHFFRSVAALRDGCEAVREMARRACLVRLGGRSSNFYLGIKRPAGICGKLNRREARCLSGRTG